MYVLHCGVANNYDHSVVKEITTTKFINCVYGAIIYYLQCGGVCITTQMVPLWSGFYQVNKCDVMCLAVK